MGIYLRATVSVVSGAGQPERGISAAGSLSVRLVQRVDNLNAYCNT
jgi:hypothetical protein